MLKAEGDKNIGKTEYEIETTNKSYIMQYVDFNIY